MHANHTRPPVTVLSGFLGAGKTTLLRHLLGQAEGRRWAAVVNDMAAINVDVQLVQGAGAASVVELGNGCVCCSVRDELAETIAELCAREKFEHVIVETTGVADPRGVADLFVRKNEFWRSLSDFAELSSLVTVVDARGFLAERERARVGAEGRKAKENEAESVGRKKPVFELMVDQAECADVIVLNKCDLVSEAELARVEGLLRGLNPRAELVRAERGQVASEFLLGRVRFDAAATLGAARWMRVLNDAVARGAGSGAAGVGGGVMKPGAAVRGGGEARGGIWDREFRICGAAAVGAGEVARVAGDGTAGGTAAGEGFFLVRGAGGGHRIFIRGGRVGASRVCGHVGGGVARSGRDYGGGGAGECAGAVGGAARRSARGAGVYWSRSR